MHALGRRRAQIRPRPRRRRRRRPRRHPRLHHHRGVARVATGCPAAAMGVRGVVLRLTHVLVCLVCPLLLQLARGTQLTQPPWRGERRGRRRHGRHLLEDAQVDAQGGGAQPRVLEGLGGTQPAGGLDLPREREGGWLGEGML